MYAHIKDAFFFNLIWNILDQIQRWDHIWYSHTDLPNLITKISFMPTIQILSAISESHLWFAKREKWTRTSLQNPTLLLPNWRVSILFSSSTVYIFQTRNISAAKKAFDEVNAVLGEKEKVLMKLMKNYVEWYGKALELKKAADTLVAAHQGEQFFRKCYAIRMNSFTHITFPI